MNADKLFRLRLAGGVVLLCAATVFAADVIMLSAPVSGETIAVAIASLVVGSIWVAAAIVFRPIYFPRWMAVLAPALPIGTAFLITRWLPAPLSGYLLPPCVHLATPLIFGVSTVLLWNPTLPTERSGQTSAVRDRSKIYEAP